ncbi:PadR family transcriptional regulator [Enemella evansiae]|uniref:PadR family transcriptional regulator n=1 Tax=Enemella evansiae TaxID=2016499 RepID=UPI000B976F3E|nr:PadR family transcriptional regulator [Enemella evansiae]OYO05515.1 PadR family transcriptional regulator [Enemella evansiae]OYO15296.1 PadR family transcriptional regulator [Enemella evansiae]
MSLRHAILGVLAAREMTGYDLSQFFDSGMGWLWSARHSQIYPLLGKLVDEGLVSGSEGTRGQHQRRVTYAITDAGRAEFLDWVGTAHPSSAEKDPFWLQAVFLDEVDPERARGVLRAYADGQREAALRATSHATELAAGITPLIRERLTHRPAAEHDRITRVKAQVFSAQAAIATTRAEQAEALISVLAETS